ncbi:MAG: hypothetical protein MZU84_08900 [Sphingobacterium sp.]|nr:hypothetical protein [Sphingobacterium sp.]
MPRGSRPRAWAPPSRSTRTTRRRAGPRTDASSSSSSSRGGRAQWWPLRGSRPFTPSVRALSVPPVAPIDTCRGPAYPEPRERPAEDPFSVIGRADGPGRARIKAGSARPRAGPGRWVMIISRTRLSILFTITAILAFSAGPVSAELVAKLPQVMNPFFLTISDGHIFVVEDSVAVHIFDLGPQGVTFVKTFGRKGQGPGEFDYIYTVRPFKDHLDILGSHKLARFSRDGDYQSEVAVTVGVFKGAAYRLGDGYVVRDLNFDEKGTATTIRLYDNDFKLVKEIGVRTNPGGLAKINLVSDYFAPRVAGDRLYVIDAAEESVVTVYDRNGVLQNEIRLPLSRSR